MNVEKRARNVDRGIRKEIGNRLGAKELYEMLSEHKSLILKRSVLYKQRIAKLLDSTMCGLESAQNHGFLEEGLKEKSMRLLKLLYDGHSIEKEMEKVGGDEFFDFDTSKIGLENLFRRYPLDQHTDIEQSEFSANTIVRSGVILQLHFKNKVFLVLSLVENEGGDVWEVLHLSGAEKDKELLSRGGELLGSGIKRQIQRKTSVAESVLLKNQTIESCFDEMGDVLPFFLNSSGMRHSDDHEGFLLDKKEFKTDIKPALMDKYEGE